MKRSSKAALLSGLVFPGVGHIVLKHYVRGSVLVLTALVASSVILSGLYEQAMAIVDRINIGDLPTDAEAILKMVSESASNPNSLFENIAVFTLGACWLFGVIDSYRLGSAQEK